MVEKWMKGNNMRTNPPNLRVRVTPKGTRGSKAYYGKPVMLFKDSDRDGVPNVFDCKPHNKRRQDVIPPMSGSNPVQEMYSRREANRQQREYIKQLRELQRAEEARAKESGQPYQIVDGTTYIDRTRLYSQAAIPVYNPQTGTITFAPAGGKAGQAAIRKMVNAQKSVPTTIITPTVSPSSTSSVKAVTSVPSGAKVYSSPLFSKAAPPPPPIKVTSFVNVAKPSIISKVVSWLKK